VGQAADNERAVVLIADDDRTMRLLIRSALEQAGFTVKDVESGEQAVALFPTLRPDLVMLNVLMPGMSGFDACRAIRALPAGEQVPILMVTGLDDSASIRQAYDVGATDFITKRVNWVVLGHRVRYMLRASRSMEALRRSEAKNRALLEQARRVAEELREAKEAAEAADRTKTEFLATMSHELRSPLHVILGYDDLLLEGAFGALTDEQLQALRRMRSNARDLLELITTVLDVSQLAAGKLCIESKPVQVEELLRQIEAETQELREQSRLLFIWEKAEPLPVLQTDPGKLKVVIKNLVSNAVKFTERGTVTIAAHSQADGVEICVSDTGIGIASESLPHIFEPFRQLDAASNPRYGGTGLGLHIVKRLLELLGGWVKVESTVGQGSTFRVWLPSRAYASG
jgi:signal transduction histidine kinase